MGHNRLLHVAPLARVGFFSYDVPMELRLNIYDGTEVVKSYVSQDFELMTGTCEDILKILDTQKVMELLDSGNDLGRYLLKKVVLQYEDFKPILLRAFKGLTEEEYRNTRMAEVGSIIVSIIIYSVQQLFSILTPTKGKSKQKKQEG